MDKEFIPYEEALALKELGFDEECYNMYSIVDYSLVGLGVYNTPHTNYILTPLYQQAFRWFRDVHELEVEMEVEDWCLAPPRKYSFTTKNKTIITIGLYDTYHEAELAALRQLIIITKD